MVAKEKGFNLCISILEFKYYYFYNYLNTPNNLCISILEFK